MSVFSGAMQAAATMQGTKAQRQSAKEATQVLMDMYQQTREDQAPWREAGEYALGAPAGSLIPGTGTEDVTSYEYQARQSEEGAQTLDMFDRGEPGRKIYEAGIPEGWEIDPSDPSRLRLATTTPGVPAKYTDPTGGGTGLLGMLEEGPGEFEADPGYEFRLKEGLRAIENIESARGRLGSMSTAKRLSDYGQESASQEYDNFMARYYQKMNPLLSLAGLGQVAAGQTSQAGIQTGQGIAANTLFSGQAQAAGYQNLGNIISNQSNNAANWAQMYYGAGGAGAAGYGTGAGGYTAYGQYAGL